jgi:VWFA-related protein
MLAALLVSPVSSSAQRGGGELPSFPNVGPGGNMTAGPDAMVSTDFAQMYLDQQSREMKRNEQEQEKRKALVNSGLVSSLDLEAPNNSIQNYNRAVTLMKAQKSKEATQYLQKAIAHYPKFVAAHISLGLAYLDQDDIERARTEFETAAQLDDKSSGSFLHLGRLSFAERDFPSAQKYLERAASLRPQDPGILSSLVFAQNQNQQFHQALDTTDRVHRLDHKGMASVHYVAAVAANSLQDSQRMERELTLLLTEDPSNALAPSARKNLEILAHNKEVMLRADTDTSQHTTTVTQTQTLPNSDRLKAQLSALDDPNDRNCFTCDEVADTALASSGPAPVSVPLSSLSKTNGWTLRKDVDQVALFFAASSHGHMVDDLNSSDIQLLDDNKPPRKIVEFVPQSKLPLRLALLIDTSGSVHDRFSFEKRAAINFIEDVLSTSSDLAFIAGFSNQITVTQDFTADQAQLAKGIEQLANAGGTSLFDAVSSACWKLADYPDDDRVARVIVIVSDGEDNSSHTTLKQAIQTEEKTGVTVYTISTRQEVGAKTDADKVLEVLAESSGGEAMFPYAALNMGRVFKELRNRIRSRYFIAYEPSDFRPNGSYRSIRVVARKNGKTLQVRTRKGYHARLEKPN